MAENFVKLDAFLAQLTKDVALAHTEMQSLQRMAWAETVVFYRQQAAQDRDDEIKQIRAEVLSEWNNMVDLAIDEVKLSFSLSKRSWFARLWGKLIHPFSGKQARYRLSTTMDQSLPTVEITVRRNQQGEWQSKTNIEKNQAESGVQVPRLNL